MNNNTLIVETYNNTERIEQIDREREHTMADSQFQKWCKDMKIGSRVEVKDYHAIQMMQDYEFMRSESRMPEFIRNWF